MARKRRRPDVVALERFALARDRIFPVRLNAAEIAWLRELAAARGVDQADAVRMAIREARASIPAVPGTVVPGTVAIGQHAFDVCPNSSRDDLHRNCEHGLCRMCVPCRECRPTRRKR